MGRDMERVTVTLSETQKDRLDELWGDDGEFDSRSAVIRHLIDEYDSESMHAESIEDEPRQDTQVSYSVSLDPHRLVREQVGTLRRMKWRLRGVPSSAYADALERVKTSLAESELGEAPVHIDAEFADIEDVHRDDRPEETGERE